MVAEDFTLPMHVLLVDQEGEAAYVTLDFQTDPSGPPSIIWN
jgi:hypothetical protein